MMMARFALPEHRPVTTYSSGSAAARHCRQNGPLAANRSSIRVTVHVFLVVKEKGNGYST
jgi:hypothetical protein